MSDAGAATLVLDLGTHKCRAVAMDRSGRVLSRATSPQYPTYRDQPGWAEQDPVDWWDAAVVCMREVVADVGAGAISGVIPVGHGPSHLPIDARGMPLGRSLIWQDSRAQAVGKTVGVRPRRGDLSCIKKARLPA